MGMSSFIHLHRHLGFCNVHLLRRVCNFAKFLPRESELRPRRLWIPSDFPQLVFSEVFIFSECGDGGGERGARAGQIGAAGGRGRGGVVEYLSLVRKLKVRRSNIVAKHGLALLNKASERSRLGSDLWTVYEQVAIACMDCHALDSAKKCINALDSKFPDSMRVGRLEGMWYEAKGSWQKAEKVYSNLLTENPSDTAVHKRRIAMAKAQGNMTGAVEGLNKYLETFMADFEAWRELADIYTTLQMYKQAAFCYEELILGQPTNALYHLGYAELLYTIGGIDNCRAARKYYSAAIELSGGQNLRALYGLCLCGAAINQTKTRGRTEEKDGQELISLAASVILKEYKQKAPSKVGLVSSILNKQKQLAPA